MSIWVDPDITLLPTSTADPETKWPPLATTTLPLVEESKVTVTLFVFVVVVDAGSINWSLLLYTETITFFVPKLWVTAFEVTFVKESEIVACSVTPAVMFVRLEPSPEKLSAVKDPDIVKLPFYFFDFFAYHMQ